jgi:tetratricopeptide (TPR) repeat protein
MIRSSRFRPAQAFRPLGALLLLAAGLGFANVARAEPTAAEVAVNREAEARKQYEQGLAAYEAGRYQQAVALFIAADELSPRAAMAFNIARAYERLNDRARALRYYRDYLRREVAPVNASGIKARIAELETLLAQRGVQQLTVLSEPTGAFVSIDGQPRGPTPWTGELAPGNHEITLLKEGYEVKKSSVVLEAQRAGEVTVSLVSIQAAPASRAPAAEPVPAPAPAPTTPMSDDSRKKPSFGPWPWITLGAGGVTLLAAAGFELARAGAEGDARAATTQIDYVDNFNSMKTYQTTGRVLAGVGGALVVAGGVLLVLDVTDKDDAPVAATAGCTNDRCWASLEGSW